jgi:hypothetical protein
MYVLKYISCLSVYMYCSAALCALLFCTICPILLQYKSCHSTAHVLSFCNTYPIFTVYVLLVLQFMSCCSDSFDDCNNIWWKLEIVMLFIVQLSLSSCQFRLDLLFPAPYSGTFCIYISSYWMLGNHTECLFFRMRFRWELLFFFEELLYYGFSSVLLYWIQK